MKVLAHYEVLEELGHGSTGTVYRARDRRLGRLVAVKVLPAETAPDRERRQRFLHEARAASALNHPNIVTIYDVGESEEGLYLAMEHVSGDTIASLAAGKPLPTKKAVDYAVQSADALAAAHAAGIVHRDVKPANVMVTRQGQVKVLDFGIAKLAAGHESGPTTITEPPETRTGALIGTIAYMSPEQAEGKPVDARTDIFSLGVVLYEMLAGRRPFQGASRVATLTAILREEPAPVSRVNERVPPELERIVARCLEKDPARRFQSMADLKVALEWFAQDQEKGKSAEVTGAGGRRRWPWAAGVMLAAVLGGAATLLWTNSRKPAWKPSPNPVRVTFDVGLSIDPALSPDGKLLAYASDRGGDGNLDIWVQTAGSEPIQRTHNEADDQVPNFSPDGQNIVFQRVGAGIFVMPALEGPEQPIAPTGLEPRFSPDGSSIAYWTGELTDLTAPSGKIFVIPFGHGAPRQLAADFADARRPLWAADGKRLLFQGRRKPEDEPEWWIAPVDGGPPVSTGILARLRERGVRPVPAPGDWKGARLLFSGTAAEPPVRHIWEVTLDGGGGLATGDLRQLTAGTGEDSEPSLAQDGRFAFAHWAYQDNLWRLPLPSSGAAPDRLERLSGTAAFETHPSISADGRMLAFLSPRPAATREIWVRNLETGAETALTIGPGANSPPVISPDGSKVAYAILDGSRRPIYVAATKAGEAPTRMVCEDCGEPSDWTPAGGIVYVAGRPRSRIELLDPASGARTTLLEHPEDSLDQAHVSPDGRWIAFVRSSASGRQLFVASLGRSGAGPWVAVTDGKSWDDKPRWWGNEHLIYYSGRDHFGCLWKQRLDGATGHPLGPVAAVYHFHRLRRSPRTHRRTGFEIAVARDVVVLNLIDMTGSVWMAAVPAAQ